MGKINERIKKARLDLHLSQEYVANFLNIPRTAVVQIEAGKRNVSAEELGKLAELFQMPTDILLNGKCVEQPEQVFARNFESLDAEDQKEILNLIEFKKIMKEKNNIGD